MAITMDPLPPSQSAKRLAMRGWTLGPGASAQHPSPRPGPCSLDARTTLGSPLLWGVPSTHTSTRPQCQQKHC